MADNTLNLSQEQRDEIKDLYMKISSIQAEGSGPSGHKKIVEVCQLLQSILPNDTTVIKTSLTAFIKAK